MLKYKKANLNNHEKNIINIIAAGFLHIGDGTTEGRSLRLF